jgi:hypothetical protein
MASLHEDGMETWQNFPLNFLKKYGSMKRKASIALALYVWNLKPETWNFSILHVLYERIFYDRNITRGSLNKQLPSFSNTVWNP